MEESSLKVTYIGHATVLVDMDGARLLTDPLLRNVVGLLRRRGSGPRLDLLQNIDAVLVSHMHWDHLDLPSLSLIGRNTRLIVPRGVAAMLRRRGFQQVTELAEWQSIEVRPLEVVGIPARHSGSRYPLGPSATCLGYTIRGSRSVYFAGDTGLFPEMAELSGRLDLALLPVWGWGPSVRGHHLTPHAAAEALALLRPRFAVPIHWGTYFPLGLTWLWPRFAESPPREFLQYAEYLAPEVQVRILKPGESLVI